MDKKLLLFDPVINEWFREKYISPTEIQSKSWPLIADGHNVLISAPTGSGKTLTAFLWALNLLITGKISTGYTSVLYISPLKALNNDIRKNLISPLEDLKKIYTEKNMDFPDIRVQTRSGDTSQSDRRKMLRRPPEILITTPESINLMLSSNGGRSILGNIDTVILDEIHSVAGTKRGTHLISAVERLTLLSGEFRRISLSATVKPLDKVRDFVSGRIIEGNLKNPSYSERKTIVVHSESRKKYRIKVVYPAFDKIKKDSLWDTVCENLLEVINKNRSTLIFTNGRKLCEKIAYKLNKKTVDSENGKNVFSHHGSLSREIREEVEKRFKDGNISAIVATNSLEMGIDIGDLDEVILIQSPPSVSSAVQRVGRAGHRVNEVSSGIFYPSHAMDIIESAAIAKEIVNGEIEDLKPVENPLDVLCQTVISMVGINDWDIYELYNFILSVNPYRNLSFKMFFNVLQMLSGKYEDSRIRELGKKLTINKKKNIVSASKGALLSLYISGGTIPDRGYYRLRDLKTGTRIGELDEEYVWEAAPGQILTLGAQNFRIKKITHNDVFVVPAKVTGMDIPFWIGETRNRDFHLSSKISDLIKYCDEMLSGKKDEELKEYIKKEHLLNEDSAEKLTEFLKLQRKKTGADLPHIKHLVIEEIMTGPGRTPYHQTVIHTFWGGRLNKPYGIALKAAFEEKYGTRTEVFSDNNCIVLMLPEKDLSFENLVDSGNVEYFLRKGIESSGFFGAKFRECAGRALLIGKQNMNMRMPLWISRLKSKKLLNSVSKYTDFPILAETYRTCLADEFELDFLTGELKSIEKGETKVTAIKTRMPSPMADNISWEQINKYMYEDDSSKAAEKSVLDYDLVSEMVWNRKFRKPIEKDTAETFERKLKRTFEGYSPSTDNEITDLVNDCAILKENEWEDLIKAVKRDHGVFPNEVFFDIVMIRRGKDLFYAAFDKIGWIDESGVFKDSEILRFDGSIVNTLKKKESLESTAAFLFEWLKFRGPVEKELLVKMFRFKKEELDYAVSFLEDEKKIVTGKLIKNSEKEFFCEAENYELLIKISRKEKQVFFETLEIEKLQPFLAKLHKISHNHCDLDNLYKTIEMLSCFPLKCDIWEKEIFPSRYINYESVYLDSLFQENEILWQGLEPKNIFFNFFTDLDLIRIPKRKSRLKFDGKMGFRDLIQNSSESTEKLSDKIWKDVFCGTLTNDTFIALRKGIENDFKIKPLNTGRRRTHRGPTRSGISMRQASIPNYGNFFFLENPERENDPISVEERRKARVRILLLRYGILFRDILKREMKEFSWSSVFKTLRIMELGGEVLTGIFFDNIDGPQFISAKAFEILKKGDFEKKIYWINSLDPISVPSMGLPVKKRHKKRAEGTHLLYKGSELILTSVSFGKELYFEVKHDHSSVEDSLVLLDHLLSRKFMPRNSLKVSSINGTSAVKNPFTEILGKRFEVIEDAKDITLYKKIF